MSKRVLGLSSALIGAFLMASAFPAITGNAIGYTSQNVHFSIGFFVFIAGLFLILASGESRLEVEVKTPEIFSKVKKEKLTHAKPDEDFLMTDPEMFFGARSGSISLGEFRMDISRLGHDGVSIIKESYGPTIEKECYSNNPEKSNPARAFYQVLFGHNFTRKDIKLELTKDEELDIENAFGSGFRHSPNPSQTKILRNYGLQFEISGKHGKIYSPENTGLRPITTSLTGDQNAGHAIAKDIIKYLNNAMRIKSEQ